MRLLIALAVLPAAFLIWYVYEKDTVEKEPFALLAKLFLFAVATMGGVIVAELVLGGIIGAAVGDENVLFYLLENFVGVALIEEGAKYLVVYAETWKSKEFNYLFDGIVYGVVASLGFATVENILYVIQGGVGVAFFRAILSVPSHAIDGVFMGYFYGLAKRADMLGDASTRKLNLVLALVVPVLLHGTYDFLLSIEAIPVFLLFELVIVILAVVHVNRMSKEAEPL